MKLKYKCLKMISFQCFCVYLKIYENIIKSRLIITQILLNIAIDNAICPINNKNKKVKDK